jgi:hypothetical protein
MSIPVYYPLILSSVAVASELIDLQWVPALGVPMHLGLVDRPFVAHNLISAQ